ncbi:MAG: phosphatidylserine decarboxylase family protein [Anaerolineae bacterium]|jgi:phosphatidylserine decarboxylase|nr:phosphatidylserine decarboxylase family protein [Anaerolineae bacterium]
MPIHREGYPSILTVSAALLLFNALLAGLVAPGVLLLTLPLSALLLGFFVQFFRNPPRTTPLDADAVLAPADGTIVAIERVPEDEYFHAERLKISIYMSALNVHLNRVPITGTVRYARYHPGRYLVAFHPKASTLNERASIVLEDERGRALLVRQIAGLLARRIVTYVQAGQAVQAGQELGFIKFGSRCDVFLPLTARVTVALEQRVRGGETCLARLDTPD